MNKKNDDENLEMDRDTSAPKDKMKKRIPRTLNSNNNKSNEINNISNSPLSKENEIEEKEEEEEEEEDDINEDENKKEEEKKEENINNSSKNNSIENNKNLVSSKNEEINLVKPKTYQELLIVLRQKIKKLPEFYEIFIIDKNNKELKINVNLKNDENSKNIRSTSCQVNLTNNKESEKIIQELKLKINTLENEKEMLISQLKENQKKYEEKFAKQNKDINSLSLLNNKLKKNLEKVNAQVTKLLNQVVANNSIPVTSNNSKMVTKAEKNRGKNNEEKEPNEEIMALKEKLKLKESQIKESFKTIEFLKKQNKKIKEDYDSLALDGKNINENNKLVEELREKNNELRELIKKKNNELRELEREYKNLISYKSGDEHLEQNKNLVNELKTLKKQNDENKAKITQLKQIVEKHQKKEMENKKNANLNFSELLQKKNIQAKIEKLKIKKGDKYEFIDFNNKKFVMNKNFSLLFNDLEKKTLFALFPDEGDFMRFNQKLDIIENNFNSSSKRFQTNINELKETIDDKEELIAYLREKIRENEMKIKILLNQIHLERNKNEKRANIQQQNSNDKNIINDTRAKSPKK